MSDITATAVGVVAKDPNHVHTSEGFDVASFRMAVTPRRYDAKASTWIDGDTSWVTVKAFRKLGAHVAASLHKGDRVLVHGKLAVRDWDDGKGRTGTSVEITAEAIGPDLLWGTAAYTSDRRLESSATEPRPAPAEDGAEPADAPGDWGAMAAASAPGEDLPF
ncbi:single-stranded DNA-binding protein [Naasia aerilata]|uniref:Single-stranded DNA-binding protein n=1 Tax=Naasia aerilata TaxID=1162966 RepID=A0ABM8GDW4_9MICO|nr:single-stranded DNA-binding protein [Naasia aerilata]BDZ46482.1 single-stranded DNA-binding protein [Naasia aerilata]